MSEQALAILSAVSTICAIVFGYAAFVRNRKKDDTDDGASKGTILTEIGYIKGGIDDIKAEQREQRQTNTGFVSRIAEVESSLKQAHKRIDRAQNQIDTLMNDHHEKG